MQYGYGDSGRIISMAFDVVKIEQELVMENASKALLIAGGVLIGILVLTFFVYIADIYFL